MTDDEPHGIEPHRDGNESHHYHEIQRGFFLDHNDDVKPFHSSPLWNLVVLRRTWNFEPSKMLVISTMEVVIMTDDAEPHWLEQHRDGNDFVNESHHYHDTRHASCWASSSTMMILDKIRYICGLLAL